MRWWRGALVGAALTLSVGPVAAQTTEDYAPLIVMIDENVCWSRAQCATWLRVQLAPSGGPAGSALQIAPPPYPVCLWGGLSDGRMPRGFTECPALSPEELRARYPDADPLLWCGSSGCRPPSSRPRD